MNDVAATLELFISEYRSRAIPPPHILMVGPDASRCEAIAKSFAERLGIGFHGNDSSKMSALGDVTAQLWGRRVAFISNIHLLKKPLLHKLAQDMADGAISIVIGAGPAARTHKMDLSDVVLIATVPAKYDCPSILLKVFETVLPVEPPTEEELSDLLGQEAWKDHIALDRDAAELLIRAAGNRSDIMLAYFRRVCGVIEQIKQSNRPQLTRKEVEDALARLRIKIPAAVPSGTATNIHVLSGQEFERVIKSLLMEMGFEAELTEVTGDGGIDIIAKLDKPFVGGRYLFQCKRYAEGNTVGAPEVRDFYGAVMADRAVKGIFITTSEFTNQAKDFAAQSGIELVNHAKLLQLFAEYGFAKLV